MFEGGMYDVAIIGGGFAGIAAALRFSEAGFKTALFDHANPAAKGELGGFAKFSGAKFSLLPAGQGLIEPAGGLANLTNTINRVLVALHISEGSAQQSYDNDAVMDGQNLALRSYRSILFLPNEIDTLVAILTREIEERVSLFRAAVTQLYASEGSFDIIDGDGNLTLARNLLYAGGRAGGSLLASLGAVPQEGKGIDLGVRVEFENRNALARLRDLGPDAKIISGSCRTFCLNVPGKIYRYPYHNFSIPGGIVADTAHAAANVGVLVRCPDKYGTLRGVLDRISEVDPDELTSSLPSISSGLGTQRRVISHIYGEPTTLALDRFFDLLGAKGLVNWSQEYRVHIPLLDWHWDTYALPSSHATSIKSLYVAGDSAGHARGLLQAAVSGWLAAEEILRQ
jgi:hypothetical protein